MAVILLTFQVCGPLLSGFMVSEAVLDGEHGLLTITCNGFLSIYSEEKPQFS